MFTKTPCSAEHLIYTPDLWTDPAENIHANLERTYWDGGPNDPPSRWAEVDKQLATRTDPGIIIYKAVEFYAFGEMVRVLGESTGLNGLLARGISKLAGEISKAAGSLIIKFASRSIEETAITRGISVIGPRAAYQEFAQKIGAVFLDVTDQEWTMRKNVEFLQGVVQRGDDVIFAGKYDAKMFNPKSVLSQEIRYLEKMDILGVRILPG